MNTQEKRLKMTVIKIYIDFNDNKLNTWNQKDLISTWYVILQTTEQAATVLHGDFCHCLKVHVS